MGIKAPKNLKLNRKGTNKFVASWKLGQGNYSDQELEWRECYKTKDSDKSLKEPKKWNKAPNDQVKKKTTSYTFEVDFDHYPMTGTKHLYRIQVRVRGKKGSSHSSWATYTYVLKKPRKPAHIIKPAGLGSGVNEAHYEWEIDKSGRNVFYKFQYQVAERLNYRGKLKDEDIAWGSNTVTKQNNYAKTYVDIPVSDYPVPPNNLTQFFRVRSYGPRGFSDWVTSYHVFGEPKQATIAVDHCVVRESASGYNITLYWKSEQREFGDPIDSVEVQYAFVNPVVNRIVESDSVKFELAPPSSEISWKKCDPLRDTSNVNWKQKSGDDAFYTDSFPFDTNGRLNSNECIVVRVDNLHDTEGSTTEGEIVILPLNSTDLFYGNLDTPTLSSISYNPETQTVQVTATNASAQSIPNSYIAVLAKDGTDGSAVSKVIGILTSGTGTFKVPDDIAASENKTFGIKAYVADYSPASPSAIDPTEYSIVNIKMESKEQWEGGSIAKPPLLKATDIGDGVALVEWDWSWLDAQSAELSWSQDKYAWESTDEPTTYIIENNKAGRWRISGLDFGEWWIRIRLIRSGDNYETYGLYSDPVSVTLAASAPPTPTLVIDPTTVALDGEIRCTWAYAAVDGSSQNQAEIVEVNRSVDPIEYTIVATISDTSQSCTIYPNKIKPEWGVNTTHELAIRTFSSFNVFSDYSTGTNVRIADALEASITLGEGFEVIPPDPEEEDAEPTYLLTQFPFSVTIGGAGDNGSTSMYIHRAEGHPLSRPDESRQYGFENETIVLVSDDADGQITIDTDSEFLLGTFDDTEQYILTATAVDEFGQRDSVSVPFTVDWDTKAHMPFADIFIDYNSNIAVITPTIVPAMNVYLSDEHVLVDSDAEDETPGILGEMSFDFDEYGNLIYTYDDAAMLDFYLEDGDLYATNDGPVVEEGARCDIYRLTSGKPEIVIAGATFGTPYVDPYPAIGRFGGYRLVYRSIYGDFITADNEFAWTDYGYEDGAALQTWDAIIDFEDDQISIPFNLDISHTWKKEFTETKYLGGSVQGDWNEGVSHTMKVSTMVAVEYQSDTYRALRRLADYSGVCHIRTPDSSSFSANIEVSETQEQKKINMVATFNLDITRVDQEEAAGMTLTEWIGE